MSQQPFTMWRMYVSLECVAVFVCWVARASPSTHHQSTPVCSLAAQRAITSFNEVNQWTQEVDFMKDELAPFLVARPPGSENIKKVRKHIESAFRSLNWTVEEECSKQFTILGFKSFVNIIATQDATAENRIVLACHYDSKMFPRGFVGAMDSAVPCAALVHAARTLHSSLATRGRTNTTIQILFLDGEEAFLFWTPFDSLYGSRDLAKKWQSSRDPHDDSKNYLQNIEMFVLLDLIGHQKTQFERYYAETDVLYSVLVELEACFKDRDALKRPSGSPPLFQNSRRRFSIDDDHKPFLQRGVKNIMHLISYPFPETWHTPSDNLESMDTAVIHDFNMIFGAFLVYITTSDV